MNGYQIAILVMLILNVGINLGKDGQARTGKHSFWESMLANGITLALLIKGGFFV